MPISDRSSRHVVNQVNSVYQQVIRWTTKSINKGFNVDGQLLYEKLFGAKPYKVTVSLSEEMKLIMSRGGTGVLKETGVRFESDVNMINLPVLVDPDYKQEVWFTMHLAKEMPYLQTYTNKYFSYGDEGKNKKGVVEFDLQSINHPVELALQVQGVLRDNYPSEFVDGVLRGAQLAVRIGTLDERIRRYMNGGVKSMGALYLNLPSLSAIHTEADVKHIRFMREGTPAPAQLVEDINLLATLWAAKKAAAAAGGDK